MYSGDTPSSYAPGGMSGYDQTQATGDVYGQAQSQGDMGHGQRNSLNLNQFQGATTYRGELGQPTMIADNNNKPPSFTDFDYGQQISNNKDLNISGESGVNSSGYSGSGHAPSMGSIRKVIPSQTSGDVDPYSKDVKAPGMSDADRRGSSETGPSAMINKLGIPDAQELVGISLVGKNFRKFYPNAYYKEEDEDN